MLRRQLTLPAVAITLGLGLALTGAGFWAGHRIVSNASEFLVRHFVRDAQRDLDETTSRRNRALSRVINDIARYNISLDDPRQMLRELYAVLTDRPEVDSLSFANQAGGDASVRQFPDGTVVSLMTDNFRAGIIREFDAAPDGQPGRLRKSGPWFDARQRAWFQKAMETHARYWTGPHRGSAEQSFSIALSAPVLGNGGSVAGVIVTGVTVASLSDEMQSLVLGKTGRVFIMGPSGRLIAASDHVLQVATSPGGVEHRLSASGATDPVVRAAASYLLTHPALLIEPTGPGIRTFAFDALTLGENYIAVSTFHLPGLAPWTIVAAVPTSDFLGPAQRALFFSLILSVTAVVLALLLQSWLVGGVLRPLATLTQAAQSIALGRWRDVPAAQRNDEVGLLARSFKLMTNNLKDTQDNLRRSEEDYRAIYENSTEGNIRTSPDGHLLSANPAFVQMLAYACEQEMTTALTNTRAAQVWVDPRVHDAVFTALFRDGVIRGYEAEFYRKDDQPIWIWGSSRLVRGSSGEPLYAESFISNITDRKQAEDALLHAQAELAHITRVTTLGELTASIAHEVNQPLTAVHTNASACLRWLTGNRPDIPEAQEAAKRIMRDSQRAGEVIHRIRAMVKRSSPSRERLHINDTITEVASLVRSEARRNAASLDMQLDIHLPTVNGDRIQLQQVILNLLMNAIEAVSEIRDGPREIMISSAINESGDVLVTVRDSGKGLDLDHIGHLFDAFYTTKASGLGIGLRISRTIIEAHGGRLWATAIAPQGAIFQFTLPAEI
jgi:PAS domain S-box-containing protein